MKTDAALNNLADKTVKGIIARNPRDKERALAALLAATLAAVNRGPVKPLFAQLGLPSK
jgi:hypothetical protein